MFNWPVWHDVCSSLCNTSKPIRPGTLLQLTEATTMENRNLNKFKLNHKNAVKVPYSGKERRKENDPTYFGYFALEGIERRESKERGYEGEERRMANDPAYFGYFALEGIERRQSESIFC